MTFAALALSVALLAFHAFVTRPAWKDMDRRIRILEQAARQRTDPYEFKA